MNNQPSKISTTDLEASPAKLFFLGQVMEECFFPFPSINKDEAETLRIVIDSMDKLLRDKDEEFKLHDTKAEQPVEFLQSLKELGLFGTIIPEEFGGINLSNTGYARVIQQASYYDASVALTLGAHSSIGMKGLLLFGSEQQKKRYLPQLASGDLIAGFCLTEPGAGSDAASIKTTATKQSDGTWVISGEKIWTTNGPIADFFTVFARTEGEQGKITAFIVEKEFAGVSIGNKENKMGIRGSATSSVYFDNVIIPESNVLGEEGKGFKIAMAILNNGRTGLGGGCVGGMKRAIRLASEYAANRKQFGRSISEFGLVKEKIAQMTVNCFAAESTIAMVGSYIDSGRKDYSVEAAISKVFVTEALWSAANEALQIAGGTGYMKELPYEQLVRDSRINMIFEGTSEILRLYIALSGLKDAGEYLKEIGKSVGNIFNDPIKGFGVLSGYAVKRLSRATSLGHERTKGAHSVLQAEVAVFDAYIIALAGSVETLLRAHQKDIIERQFLMKRIADVVIDIFVGLCVISRVSSMIEQKSVELCKNEIDIAHIFTQQAKRRMNQNLRRLERHEDKQMEDLSDYIVKRGGYEWDTI
jgi:acyl-CoA dehydrogenase family member 9